jgi:plastocyanin
VIAAIIVSGVLGFYLSTIGKSISTGSSKANTVNLDVIPDYGGPGYDAFVLAANVNAGVVPTPATNTTGPGVINNNITVSAGTTVNFVITSIDTAILQNFSAPVMTPFSVYNDTANGVVSSHYGKGQVISNMPVSHTFTIMQLSVNIPIPPTTIVSFSATFSKSGMYQYMCETPCGPGMGLTGYMQGYVIVK